MIKLKDYIEQCLQDDEFRKYWEEDFGDEKLSIGEALQILEYTDDGNELYKSQEEYKQKYDELIKNKGIKSTIKINPDIEFYETENRCPVKDFLEQIKDKLIKEKTVKNIYKLSELGNGARMPLSRHVEDGIFELRTKQGNNIDRIFYFFVFGNKIIMTNGYIKKQEKIDNTELKRAKKYMNDYLNNH